MRPPFVVLVAFGEGVVDGPAAVLALLATDELRLLRVRRVGSAWAVKVAAAVLLA